jgi:predicted pyridoxine 5'-phosphate oxidase superfamily flavin-nucleotide-binding protein
MQEEAGIRSAYDRMEKMSVVDGLTDNEIKFIEERERVFIWLVGENEYPYVQYRVGLAGFIKVIDNKAIGIVDFRQPAVYFCFLNRSFNCFYI